MAVRDPGSWSGGDANAALHTTTTTNVDNTTNSPPPPRHATPPPQVDRNNDGVISFEEVRDLLQIMYGPALGLTDNPKKDTEKQSKKVRAMFKLLMNASGGKQKQSAAAAVAAANAAAAANAVGAGIDSGAAAGAASDSNGLGSGAGAGAGAGAGDDGGTAEGEAAAVAAAHEELPKGVDLEVFIDAMIDILILPANVNKRVLERLLTLGVSDNDWESAKKRATMEYVQVAVAGEMKKKKDASGSGSGSDAAGDSGKRKK